MAPQPTYLKENLRDALIDVLTNEVPLKKACSRHGVPQGRVRELIDQVPKDVRDSTVEGQEQWPLTRWIQEKTHCGEKRKTSKYEKLLAIFGVARGIPIKECSKQHGQGETSLRRWVKELGKELELVGAPVDGAAGPASGPITTVKQIVKRCEGMENEDLEDIILGMEWPSAGRQTLLNEVDEQLIAEHCQLKADAGTGLSKKAVLALAKRLVDGYIAQLRAKSTLAPEERARLQRLEAAVVSTTWLKGFAKRALKAANEDDNAATSKVCNMTIYWLFIT
jgi:hypothetical protein